MTELTEYIAKIARRGECQCGKCADYRKDMDRPAPEHSANVHFFWVSQEGGDGSRLRALLQQYYPSPERLEGGPSYIEIGAELDSQELALLLIGVGAVLGLWQAVTPASFGITGPEAAELAGKGMVMCTGLKPIPA